MDVPRIHVKHTNSNELSISKSPSNDKVNTSDLTQTGGRIKVNKKSLRKKSPPKLSIKQNLILEKLKLFYEHNYNITQLLDIINSTSKISLRIIDWFVTNYSKKNFVVIPVKKTCYVMGEKLTTKTRKKTTKTTEIDINVFLDYKRQLKSFSKKQFDPFCRRERISFKYNDSDSIVTTVGQLNFFKWAIENDILKYIGDNLKDIEDDMNQNIKKPSGKKKKSSKKGECPQKKNTPKSSLSPTSLQRKKRRELSTSAVKSLNKHGGTIVLSFD
jgi:hypothetical protein